MEQLDILPKHFPEIISSQYLNNISLEQQECHCPKRGQGAPPIPTKIHFAATEENLPKLKQWLLDYYGGTAFKTCEHL